MNRFLDYRNITYISISFFFIVNIFILFDLDNTEKPFFSQLVEYNQILTIKNEVFSLIDKKKSDKLFKFFFNKPNEIPKDFLPFKDVKLTTEPVTFHDSNDTYGFFNIYINSYKFSYPFKKIDMTPIKNDFTFYVTNPVQNEEELNLGELLEVDCSKKIFIPSSFPLYFNIHYKDLPLFNENYLYKGKDINHTFFTGTDNYGIFSILKTGMNYRKTASKFRFLNYSDENISNIYALLNYRYMEWKVENKQISLNSLKEDPLIEKNSIHKNTSTPKESVYFLNRAVYYSNTSDLNIKSYNSEYSYNGIYIFKNIIMENSSIPFKYSGKSTLICTNRLNILRNIHKESNDSLLSLISLNDTISDSNSTIPLLKAERIDSYIYSNLTPINKLNTEIHGNLTLSYFDKKNLKSTMKILAEDTPRDNYVLNISPVINYFQGDI